MDVGGKKLKVAKASSGSTQVANFDVGITAISGLASQSATETEKGRVVQLLNMVTAEELMDSDEYEGKAIRLPVPFHSNTDTLHRNLRGCARGVFKVWHCLGSEGPTTFWRQSTVCWRWQDLRQV